MATGCWRTICGRHIYIQKGQSLTDAMKKSGVNVDKDSSNTKSKQNSNSAKESSKKEVKTTKTSNSNDEINEKKKTDVKKVKNENEETKTNFTDDEIKDAVERFTSNQYSEIRGASIGQQYSYTKKGELINGKYQKFEKPEIVDITPGYKKSADALDYAISKSKGYDNEIYRGISISKENLSKYKVGDIIDQKGVSSWSKNSKKAEEYSNKTEGNEKVVFVQKGAKNAFDVSKMTTAKNWNEEEVLLSSKLKQKITKISKNNGTTYVYVDET